ncbi:MAG: Crp/Fnr family transcriptional regulator [Pedobacter sp.]
MFETLFHHIELKVLVTPQEKSLIEAFLLPKKLKKRQYLLQQGDHCKFFTFVAKGLLKSYNIDEKGAEHISVFAWEGWWISDMWSFFHGKDANVNIEAIEDSDLLMISLQNYNKLLEQVPVMERYFRILYQNSLLTKDLRLLSAATHTAEEKYLRLLSSQPELMQRVRQSLIASYLGLAPETISRIKQKLIRNSPIDRDQ